MNKTLGIILGLIVIGGGAYFLTMDRSDYSMVLDNKLDKETESMQKIDETGVVDKSVTIVKAGTYETYASDKVALASATHKVVLFFRASWCPTCRTADMDIRANLSKIPEYITILDVNYDNSSELKKKYGVTYQHTFVQVDKDGNLIKKWSGSSSLSAIVAEVK